MHPLPHTPTQLRRATVATRVQFLALGMLCGTWGAHIASVRAHYALSDGRLSLVLLAAAAGTVLSLFIAGRFVRRLGARRAAARAALLMCLMLGSALVYPAAGWLLPAMLVFGAAMSLFDVAINTEGSELESQAGRPVMSNLHGMFSVGGMAGAGLASLLLKAAVPPALQLAAVCAALAAVVLVASRGMLAVHAQAEGDGPQADFAWPRGRLLVIGLLIFAGMTAEGVMYDWSVLYLQQDVGLPQADAALGYACFTGAMAASRLAGDVLRRCVAETLLLRAGAALAAVAMAVVLLTASAPVAFVGLALAGAGLAPVAPILFNAATRVPGVSRAAAIASVTSVGYSGFVIGPPLIGALATAQSLTVALGVVVLSAALLALGAGQVPAPPSIRPS